MHSAAALAITALGALAATASASATVNVFTGNDCTGTETVASIDVSSHFCFQGLGGNAVNDLVGSQENCAVTTWSGNNCEGSSMQIFAEEIGPCFNIPFASISLDC